MSLQGAIEIHNIDLCSELLGDRPSNIDFEGGSGSNKATNTLHVSPRAASRCSTSQAVHAGNWLSRKARRAVVVS